MAFDYADAKKRIIRGASGILHLGGHTGQEANLYHRAGKPVLWVEGDPRLFPELVKAIAPYPTQRALNALLGRENLDSVQFHIANNNGASSSIFPLAPRHGFEGIQLKMIDSITLPLARLDSLISAQKVAALSHWVVDLQGAELEALVGAGELLQSCLTMEIEVSKRRVYDGGVDYSQLESFLGENGFTSLWEPARDSHGDHLFFRTRR
jgi:FkbM family methyltransferase